MSIASWPDRSSWITSRPMSCTSRPSPGASGWPWR
jgi:hypothetical protein